ncbi:MAG: transporter substrate-binding domain-containing protein [Anaerovibrio sp.]|nr:transporter substrate-binding domain-containing protein [Veillonellaceae bacterium]MCI7265995.1 transporter substrate-binding domain-containing protein [Veillonellaceae bacterium]MDY5053499.1 transporter substrate-binding domain-containing protein [Anaerovibrio sp.]
MNIKKIGKLLVTGILVGALAVTAGCGSKDKSANQAGDGGKKVITVAHTNYYVPYDFVNEKGESDGFEVAVMKEVAKKLPQYDFKFVPTSDDDLLIGVESGKYTVGTKGIWITEPRKKKYIFPKNNIGASVIGLIVRKENTDKIKDLASFADFSGKLVPIASQDARYSVIDDFNKENPDHQIKLVPSEAFQVADAYSWVLEGRYDAYLEVELSYKNNIQKEDAPYHKFNDQLTYIRYKGIPTYPIINKNEQQFADDYDKAIEELRQEGKIAELEQQYFGESLSDYLK